jgi:hypothetical protein
MKAAFLLLFLAGCTTQHQAHAPKHQQRINQRKRDHYLYNAEKTRKYNFFNM